MSEPTQPPHARSGSPGAAVLGGILIVLGLIFFAGNQLNLDIGKATWPLYVIAPGVALATLGLTQRKGSGLTIFGSIVTMIGLVLLYQNASDHWESWAYAWALVAPGGSGIGMLLYGTRSGDRKMARDGFWMILVALGIFAVGLVFFEGILGISGDRLPLPKWVLPVAVMGIGVLVLIRGLTFREHRGPDWSTERGAPEASPAQGAAEPPAVEGSSAPQEPGAES
jgi:hypothetical protein